MPFSLDHSPEPLPEVLKPERHSYLLRPKSCEPEELAHWQLGQTRPLSLMMELAELPQTAYELRYILGKNERLERIFAIQTQGLPDEKALFQLFQYIYGPQYQLFPVRDTAIADKLALKHYLEFTRPVKRIQQNYRLQPQKSLRFDCAELEAVLKLFPEYTVLSLQVIPTQYYPWELQSEQSWENMGSQHLTTILTETLLTPGSSIDTSYHQPSFLRIALASSQPLSVLLVHALGNRLLGPGNFTVHPARTTEALNLAKKNLNILSQKSWLDNPLEIHQQRSIYLYERAEISALFNLNPPTIPEIDLPQSGLKLGFEISALNRELYLPSEQLKRHCYILGKTGMGKSTLLQQMILEQIQAGEGLAVIDPHGDLIQDLLKRIPKPRMIDVVYLDTAQTHRPFGINLFEASNDQEADLLAQEFIGMFEKLFGSEIFGPRIANYCLNAALTLMSNLHRPGTLLDILRLFTDEEFRQQQIKQIRRPLVKAFWEREYQNTNPREKYEIIPYLAAKFSHLTSQIMANIVGQPRSTLPFKEFVKKRRIDLVSINQALVGEINARLLSILFITKLTQACYQQALLPQKERQQFTLYLDEFQKSFVSPNHISQELNQSFSNLLSEGRKFGIGLIMPNQFMHQLPIQMREALLGNVGTLISFGIGPNNAQILTSEFGLLNPESLRRQRPYQACIRFDDPNGSLHIRRLRTLSPAPICNDENYLHQFKQWSGEKYGRSKKRVAAELALRLNITPARFSDLFFSSV